MTESELAAQFTPPSKLIAQIRTVLLGFLDEAIRVCNTASDIDPNIATAQLGVVIRCRQIVSHLIDTEGKVMIEDLKLHEDDAELQAVIKTVEWLRSYPRNVGLSACLPKTGEKVSIQQWKQLLDKAKTANNEW